MKRFLIIAVILALISPVAPAYADCPGTFNRPTIEPLGYQQLTVSSTAVAFTLPAGPVRMAVVMVEDNPVRFRDDGTNPSASVGTLVQPNVAILVCGAAMNKFRAIRQGSDAKLSVHFYGD